LKFFSGKYHLKFPHFVNFSYRIFRQNILTPKLTELLRLCRYAQEMRVGTIFLLGVTRGHYKSTFVTKNAPDLLNFFPDTCSGRLQLTIQASKVPPPSKRSVPKTNSWQRLWSISRNDRLVQLETN